MRKIIRRSCAVLSVLFAALYICIVAFSLALPQRFSVVEGSSLALPGILTADKKAHFQGESVSAAAMTSGTCYQASLRLFGLFPVRDVTVQVVDQTMVIPCGTPFGIKMYTDGVLVVGMTDVDTAAGSHNPARAAGIKKGDVIESINGKKVMTTEQVAQMIEATGGKTVTLHIRRDNIKFDVRFTPAKSVSENRYKAGMWIRDSSAGIGTMTFYMPSTMVFGGLGHAVCDVDTNELIPIASGEIVPARVYSVNKSVSGIPGELRGGFEPGVLGNLTVNAQTGIFGHLSGVPMDGQAVPIAMKQQVKTGYAQVLTTIDGTEPQLYDIQIEQVRYNDASPTRNMIICVTDPDLLEKTGGIVQGMSGSPILQDGKLVGAVTHVFVNDPTKGYAIFAENMLETAQSVAKQQKAAS